MYMSRVLLDLHKRDTLRAISCPGKMHGAIERCFACRGPRRLWRVDRVDNKTHLLILSEEKPNCVELMDQFSPEEMAGDDRRFQIKDYDPFLGRLETGVPYRFRLCANPTHQSSDGGKRMAHVTSEQQSQWLIDRAERNGFHLDLGEKILHQSGREFWTHPSFIVSNDNWKLFDKKQDDKRHLVTLRTCTFDGVLTISDLDGFKHALTHGIGHAKAYGCGLMTVMRLHV